MYCSPPHSPGTDNLIQSIASETPPPTFKRIITAIWARKLLLTKMKPEILRKPNTVLATMFYPFLANHSTHIALSITSWISYLGCIRNILKSSSKYIKKIHLEYIRSSPRVPSPFLISKCFISLDVCFVTKISLCSCMSICSSP